MPAISSSAFGGEPISADRLAAIKERIQLVDIDALRLYEKSNQAKVAEIALSLRSSGVMINPVIVDPNQRLLIDGHHRVGAFDWLELPRIPAFLVDYLSDDVAVKGWSRISNAQPESIKRAFDLPGGTKRGGWAVVAENAQQGTMACRRFETPRESAYYLDHLTFLLQAGGNTVTLHTEADALRSGHIHSYIRPIVGKAEVLEIIDQGKVFPYEVNRHLIDERPLELRIPLEAVGNPERFRRHIEQLGRDATTLAMNSGLRQGDRVYEESVTLFFTESRGLRYERE